MAERRPSAAAGLTAPHAAAARRAALWSVPGPLVWLAQAALLAHVIAGLLTGAAVNLPLSATAFLALAALRSLLETRAQALSQALARQVVAEARRNLLAAVARRAPAGAAEDSAGLASLLGEKAAHLGPWVERYRPAMLRVMAVPPVLLLAALSQSWAAALSLLVTGPLIPLFMALIGMAARAASEAHLVETGALNRLLIDRIAALTDLRLLGATERAAADLHARSDSLRDRTMKVLRLAFLSSTVLEFLAALGVALVAVLIGLSLLGLIGWGGWGGAVTPFGGIFVLLIAPDFYQPLRDLASAWHDRAAAEAAAEEIAQEIARPLPVIPGSAAVSTPGRGATAAEVPRGALVWQGLVLEPGPGRRLCPPDGQVLPGEAVALMAPSGAGKSSLLAALAGLMPVAAGGIALGGVALSDETAGAIRARLGWLPQTPRFPAESLRRFLTAGTGADEARLNAALTAARAADVVARLPLGLATRPGETGGGLSGGEARRLILTRALLHPPAVLLADEPTADLDAATAAEVTAALLALRAAGTALLVATHDATLAAAMDRILVLAGPEIGPKTGPEAAP